MQRRQKHVACIGALAALLVSLPTVVRSQTVAAGGQHSIVLKSDGTVWTFGAGGSGQLGSGGSWDLWTPVQVSGLTGGVAVAAGYSFSLVLKSDGTVWAFGNNDYGQLGDGTTDPRSSPVQVSSLSDVVAIAAGEYHSLALKSDGSIYAWGRNNSGQLGIGSWTSQSTPTAVGTGYNGIAAGWRHSLAVKSDGTAWSWGENWYGQLGDGTYDWRNAPVQISNISTATAVAGGADHTLILKNNGTVAATGRNDNGRLGDGTTFQRETPVAVSGLSTVVKIEAGGDHSLAVLSDGTVRGWGQNNSGQLGDGTTWWRPTAVQPSDATSITQITGGGAHTVAVSSTGVVWTWGGNGSGRLGDGTFKTRYSPISISTSGYTWKAATPMISVASGDAWWTFYTQITNVMSGSGSEMHYTTNGSEPTLSDPVVASGTWMLIDRSQTLKVRTWLTGFSPSNIAQETYTFYVDAVSISPNGGTYTSPRSVTLSTVRRTRRSATPSTATRRPNHRPPIAVRSRSELTRCSRPRPSAMAGTSGAESTATFTMNFGTLSAPTVDPAPGTYTSSVTVTPSATAGATIRYTTNGAEPTGSSPVYSPPLTLTETTTLKFKAFHVDYSPSAVTTAAYTIQTAAVTLDPVPGTYSAGTTITLWSATPGSTIAYTLNGLDPTTSDPSVPTGGTIVVGNYTLKARAIKAGTTSSAVTTGTYAVNGTSATAMLAASSNHSHALRPDGTVWSWGDNQFGRLGDGTETDRRLPVVTGGVTGAINIGAGLSHGLAVLSSGGARAWGFNSNGWLGDGSTSIRVYPVAVSGASGFVEIAGGNTHSIARKSDGSVLGWGYGGLVGDGTSTERTTPVAVSGLTSGVVGIAAGSSHSLAVKSDGTVWAWGTNGNSQIGDGTTISRQAPVQVSSITDAIVVAGGSAHSFALRTNGTVLAWGWNADGQLGDGSIISRDIPVAVSALTDVTAIASGGAHGLAVKADGTVWSWGANGSGQLGNGTTTASTVPIQVPGLPTIVRIAAGTAHSLALASDLSVWVWGSNSDGQIGDGTTANRLSPVEISGPGMGWKVPTPTLSVAPGLYFASQSVVVASIDGDATLHYTINGADPTTSDPVVANGATVNVNQSLTLKVAAWHPGFLPSPVASAAYELKVVAPGITPATGGYGSAQSVDLSTATPSTTIRYTLDGSEPTSSSTLYSASFNVASSSTVKAKAFRAGWTTSDSSASSYWISEGTVATPMFSPAAGTFTSPPLVVISVTTASAVIRYTLDGSDPTTTSLLYTYPFVVDATTTVKAKAFKVGYAASAIGSAAYAVDAAGHVATPTVVPGAGRYTTKQTITIAGPSGATLYYTIDGDDPTESDTSITSGSTLVVDASKVVKVRAFQSGLEPSAVRRADYAILGTLAAGDSHGLAIKSDRTLWAWGNINFNVWQCTPQQLTTDVVAAAAGFAHSVFAKSDGTVWAWGQNAAGQLGDGTTTYRAAPVQVSGLVDVVAVAAGHSHSLALKSDGTVWAWGHNVAGELGDGTTTVRVTPVQVVGLLGVTAIAAGWGYWVAVQSNGSNAGLVWAWGRNSVGQLGDGSFLDRRIPVRTVGLSSVTAIAAGSNFALAIKNDGTAWSWGRNDSGQLGTGMPLSAVAPIAQRVLPLANVRTIAAGRLHALAVDADGWLWGWGRDTMELGARSDLLISARATPKRLAGMRAPTLIASGLGFSLVAKTDGSVWGIGLNTGCQLGDDEPLETPTWISSGGLVLASNAWLTGDADADGVMTWSEYLRGLDPLSADTNKNGLTDGAEVASGQAGGNPDSDGDGAPNWVEVVQGTDPFAADTDGDSVNDGTDAFPLDPTRSAAPQPTPGDTTPPVITLIEPTNAVKRP